MDSETTSVYDSLVALVQRRDTAGVKSLLSESKPDVVAAVINRGLPGEWFKMGPRDETPLHIACHSNDAETARVLISFGASCSALNSVKQSPLDVCSPQLASDLRALSLSAADSTGSARPDSSASLPHSSGPPSRGPSPAVDALASDIEHQLSLDGQHQQQQSGSNPHSLHENNGNVCSANLQSAGIAAPAPVNSTKDKETILRGLKDYGVSLFEDAGGRCSPGVPGSAPAPLQRGHSRIRELPQSLQEIMDVLSGRVKGGLATAAEVVDALDKYGRSETNTNGLSILTALVNAQTKSLDAYSPVTTQTLVDAFVAYFEMLPGPIIPTKYYPTVVCVANVLSSRAIMAQSRILFNYLPTISRVFLGHLSSFFASTLDILSNPTALDIVSSRFFKYFFRDTNDLPKDLSRMTSPCSFIVEDLYASAFLKNIQYVTMQSDQPEIATIRHPNEKQLTVHDFILYALALYDFSKSNAAKANNNTLTFSKNDRILLVNLHRNDWLEGMLGKQRGFLPKSYVKLILHTSLPSTLKTLPGMPTPISTVPAVLQAQCNVSPQTLEQGNAAAAYQSSPGVQAAMMGMGASPQQQQLQGSATMMGPLPCGWVEAKDQRGRTYYINVLLKTSQWERPTAPAPGPNGMMASPALMMAMNPMVVSQNPGMMFNQNMMMAGRMTPQMMMMMSGNPMMNRNPMMGGSPMMGGNPMMGMMQTQQAGGIGPRPLAQSSPATVGNVGGTPGADAEYQRRMEQLKMAEKQFMQQQMQAQMQMQMQQAKLVQKEQELAAKAQLESLKQDSAPNWQISYSELELGKKIGEGGFGEVYCAKWRGTTVAVKILKHKGDSYFTPDEASRFSKEVSILRALNHPNLVLFLGACLTPRLCMISEYMFGGSLYDLLYKKKKIPDHNKRCVLSLDVAKAMAYLHNSKPAIVHRDLKSLNILLDEKGEHAKVCDVGLARFKKDSDEGGDGTLVGAVGTYSWMPPEMLKNQPYTEKADVYSYGLVLYEICTGKLPFAGMTPQQISVCVAIRDERPPLPSSLNSKWKDIITACWTADYTKRPSFIEIINMLTLLEKK